MNLAYLDDAGTDKHSSIVMCGAVIIFLDAFGAAENLHSAAVQQIIPVEQIEDKFQGFHAAELYNGEGPFAGIDEAQRFDAIRVLLLAVQTEKLPYIYAIIPW